MTTSELLKQLDLGEEENMFVPKEESGLEWDVRTALLRQFGTPANVGEAEYFFHMDEQGAEEETGRIFVCRYIIVSEIPEENIAPMCAQIAVENYSIPLGILGYDPEENAIIYTLQTPFPDDMTDEEMEAQADLSMFLSRRMAARYAAAYVGLSQRRML